MTFRRKLLLMFALTVAVSVAGVAWIVSAATREVFAQSSAERTADLMAHFQKEFQRRGDDIVHRVEAIAGSDAATRIALASNRRTPDYGAYLNEAKLAADNQQLDFLEFVDDQGTIISSAQSPAKFGYKENLLPQMTQTTSKSAFLRTEELPDGPALGLFAVRGVSLGDQPLYVIGGRRLDRQFLEGLPLPVGMRTLLYASSATEFSPQSLIDPSVNPRPPEKLAPLIQSARQSGHTVSEIIHWSSDAAEDETVHGIPLKGLDQQVLGVLLLGDSRRSYVELLRHIRLTALLVGGGGILVAILLSSWVAARVTRPVEQLAEAAREVAAGDWNAQVPVTSSDEIGELAESFNRMTHELLEHKERLVQTERVAAWRELARRLAHELKNPLFPLQLTVENLVRARQQSPEQFEEVFRESSATLLAEIANLKTIISRFSEFSKMPQPQFQRVQVNEMVQKVARLFQAQLRSMGNPPIECQLELGESVQAVAADPDLLHRALSNLVLNAMDAMPKGGTLTLTTRENQERVFIHVSDPGAGLTPEECERLFTPYYTSKAHGTGLGLAIVQSVVSDHGGRITVQSQPDRGTTFLIELPRNLDKQQAVQAGANRTTV